MNIFSQIENFYNDKEYLEVANLWDIHKDDLLKIRNEDWDIGVPDIILESVIFTSEINKFQHFEELLKISISQGICRKIFLLLLFPYLIEKNKRIKAYQWFQTYKRYVKDDFESTNVNPELFIKPYYNLYFIIHYFFIILFFTYSFFYNPLGSLTKWFVIIILIITVVSMFFRSDNRVENSIFKRLLKIGAFFSIPKINENSKINSFNKIHLSLNDEDYI
jgi:hypothetical protein